MLHGGKPVRYALLNENQSYFLVTLLRNSEKTVPLKVRLTESFAQTRDQLWRLYLEKPTDWERVFEKRFYSALCHLFPDWAPYEEHRPLPDIIGRITHDYVYSGLPKEVYVEVKDAAKESNQKQHQHLTDEGLKIVNDRKRDITTLAESSHSYKDFIARCNAYFFKAGIQGVFKDSGKQRQGFDGV
jgi:hypothetical protein